MQPEGQRSLAWPFGLSVLLELDLSHGLCDPFPRAAGLGNVYCLVPLQVIGIRAQYPGLCLLLGLRAGSQLLKSALFQPPRLVLVRARARTRAHTCIHNHLCGVPLGSKLCRCCVLHKLHRSDFRAGNAGTLPPRPRSEPDG